MIRKRLVSLTLSLLLIFTCLVGGSLLSTENVEALPAPISQFAACAAGTFFGFPSWDSCLQHNSDGSPQINKISDIWLIAFPIVETMIRAAGYLAVGFVVWGGFKYIKSQGNPGEITAARTVIFNAIIGLVITIFSVAAVQFIANRF